MNIFKENWFKLSLIALAVVFLGFLFYWFLIRPGMIRSACVDTPTFVPGSIAAKYTQPGKTESFDPVAFAANYTQTPTRPGYRKATESEYEYCLRKHGL
ncbi:MAG: hypothetical protein UX06_C0001G0005 [Candidatus Giovannonibacteria bacterium GW2011_GWA2_45_21]|uniref:Uncharacterized protein n=1 Tax=Candidatus Giovannonibacteria bacterium GW2011_GWA2_45_21 TaxID=1618649 RepID=A0A0G1MAD0_9BACT|nr:MAG: hypothetical protein UX06_C0001G0005 [Candidatus Giovannonibacteria bacterium GW2011_GWA2_45_21]